MPDTTRRVNVMLTIPTEEATGDVLNAVLSAVQRAPAYDNNLMPVNVENAHVHAFDLDDEDDGDEQTALLVLRGDNTVTGVFIDDPGSAHHLAGLCGGVIAALPITADYRGEDTADA